ncbi:DUF6401 family natural product biosynthesis protein [Actinophytocola sediminis]
MRVRRLERFAHRLLDRLHDQVGAGLVAAGHTPGLAAEVDQHTAAVRDILSIGVEGTGVAGPVLLAGYAQGVLDHVRERGDQLRVPDDRDGWARADWISVRLVAVCALAKDLRTGLPVPSVDGLPSLA